MSTTTSRNICLSRIGPSSAKVSCERKDNYDAVILRRFCLVTVFVLAATQILPAQQKPRVFFSDDLFLESSPPAYLWFYDQKGILDKAHAVDGTFVEIVKAFAKNCECTVVKEPDDADYVVLISRHDVIFRSKLAEKKFVVVKVDGEKLMQKDQFVEVVTLLPILARQYSKTRSKIPRIVPLPSTKIPSSMLIGLIATSGIRDVKTKETRRKNRNRLCCRGFDSWSGAGETVVSFRKRTGQRYHDGGCRKTNQEL